VEDQTILRDNSQKLTEIIDDECQKVVHRLSNLPGFQLLAEDEFSELIIEGIQEVQNQGQGVNYFTVAIKIYSEKMHQAAVQTADLFFREKCFQELARYLYRMAYNFYLHQSLAPDERVDKAQESTQVALELIYSHLASVKTPISFLKWCSVILRRVCLQEAQKRNTYISLYHIDDDTEIPIFGDFSTIDRVCIYECLAEAIARLNQKYQQVIKLSYFSASKDGGKMSDEEIAHELKVNVGTLYTQRSRAISLLKEDKLLCQCIQGSV